MKMKFLPSIVIAFAFLISCKEGAKKTEAKIEEKVSEHTEKKTEHKKEDHKKHWAYTGETNPEHWAELEGDAACGGNHQSPINIISSDAVVEASGLIGSDIHYVKETVIDNIVNNGHSIQYNFKGNKNYVNFNNKRYNLAQFHFHSPSEHTINGTRYPLVMHMVHVSEDNDFVVFAVMYEEGERSKSFDFLESYLPIKPKESKAINKPYDFNSRLPVNFEHYYYKGSLTTPPCTEAVNWFIFTTPETISVDQVKAISELMPKDNYRTEQPLNNRKITLNK